MHGIRAVAQSRTAQSRGAGWTGRREGGGVGVLVERRGVLEVLCFDDVVAVESGDPFVVGAVGSAGWPGTVGGAGRGTYTGFGGVVGFGR